MLDFYAIYRFNFGAKKSLSQSKRRRIFSNGGREKLECEVKKDRNDDEERSLNFEGRLPQMGSLSKARSSVFERRTATGSRLFAFLGIGFWKIVYLRVETLSKTKFGSVKAY